MDKYPLVALDNLTLLVVETLLTPSPASTASFFSQPLSESTS